MIRLLLDAGANPNAIGPSGETALMTATRIGDVGAVTLLLDRGAVLDAKAIGKFGDSPGMLQI